MIMKLWGNIEKKIVASEYEKAVSFLEKKILSSGISEFYPVANSHFNNKKDDVLKIINKFIQKNSKAFSVKSIYLEMNGFDINYDSWYFDCFAFDKVGKTKDLDWLCDFNSEPWRETKLLGMKSAQKVFEWYHEKKVYSSNPEYKEAYESAQLLVMCKFVKFISDVVNSGDLVLKIPVFATAHDFDIIGKIKP